jgi:hypothetical protein
MAGSLECPASIHRTLRKVGCGNLAHSECLDRLHVLAVRGERFRLRCRPGKGYGDEKPGENTLHELPPAS